MSGDADLRGGLELVSCAACGAPVPLAETSPVPCLHCGASVPLPDEHLERARARAVLVEARRHSEREWGKLARGSARWHRQGALGLSAMLPPVASALAASWEPPLAGLVALAYVVLPAVLPGAVWWGFAVTSKVVDASVSASLSPVLERDQAACRCCGAPLGRDEHALFVTCLYCGTDHLLQDPSGRWQGLAQGALRTLGEAVSLVRLRRRSLLLLLVFSALAVAALGMGVVWVFELSHRR